jgi:hypothetical protein
VVQLEKRGIEIGDRTSGSVMAKTGSYFACSSIDYEGDSLEHRGVLPDEVAFPLPLDLAYGRDPVMTSAAEELGVTRSPEDAGKLFPYEWPKKWHRIARIPIKAGIPVCDRDTVRDFHSRIKLVSRLKCRPWRRRQK